MHHLLSIADLEQDTVRYLVDSAVRLAEPQRRGLPLAGSVVGIYFRRTSTRTRSAFQAGAMRLGASTVFYGPSDLQVTTGETWSDTARVMSEYLDALVLRTNDDMAELREIAGSSSIPVINALTRHEHPTQAIGDLATLREHFGQLSGRRVLYVGEGNSSAAALAMTVAAHPGLELVLITPEGYGLPRHVLQQLDKLDGADRIEERHDIGRLPRSIDAVYATRWQTMGVSHDDDGWLAAFDGFKVTRTMLAEVARSGAEPVFLHDLPTVRGQDADDDVLDGPQSLVWRQAHHKMTSAMAVLEWSLSSGSDIAA